MKEKEEEQVPCLLSIFDICRQGSRVLGPGLRYIIWTQGCPFRCDGCVTPSSRPRTHDKLVRIDELADDILCRPYIEGITISGGEPFIQAGVLADFLDIVQGKRPELTVITYTGFLLETLMGKDEKRLLNHVDLLIDGPYVRKLNDNKGIRGASNQRLHFLTSRLLPWREALLEDKRKVEFHVSNEGAKVYGVPPVEMITSKEKQH